MPKSTKKPCKDIDPFSAKTSIPQKAAVFKMVKWLPGQVNLDLGGGKFDMATEFLAQSGAINLVVDPGNRSPEWNRRILARLARHPADSATIANVLNVIPEASIRRAVLEDARRYTKPGAPVYVLIHEGDKDDVGKRRCTGTWQENRRTATYLPEIRAVFPEVGLKGKLIVARSPGVRANPARAAGFARASAASADPFTSAVRSLKFGKRLPGAIYVHSSLLPRLPAPVVAGVVEAARLASVEPMSADLLKLGVLDPTVSFLAYPGFDREPFPALAAAITVSLATGKVTRTSYKQGEGTPILHRKETFLAPEDPRIPALSAVTKNLERRGLFRDTKRIGRRGTWEQMLRDAGVAVVGTSVRELRTNPTRRSVWRR